jgi:hypothetical protein
MRSVPVLISLLFLTGCTYRLPLYTPEVLVRPGVVGHAAHVSVRFWGAEVADYRFMGAVQQPDGAWVVRLDPVWMGIFSQESNMTVREGEILPLGPGPAVRVQFVSISATELTLRAVDVHIDKERY